MFGALACSIFGTESARRPESRKNGGRSYTRQAQIPVVAGPMPGYTHFVAVSRAARPSRAFERALMGDGYGLVAGVDEVGRGSWAGPVVAAAVILPDRPDLDEILAGVRDSKQLTPQA